MGEAVFKHKLLSENTSVAQNFKRAMLSSVVNYQRLTYELKRICELFEKEQIPHMPLKGAVIRKLYPDPWMRTSGDIDILVKKEDAEQAVKLLTTHFYKDGAKQSTHDFLFRSQNGVTVELHYDLIEKKAHTIHYKHDIDFSCLENAWDTAVLCEDSQFRYKMNEDLFYFYHIAHMAKHFLGGGCGIRSFIDLYLIKNNLHEISQSKKNLLENAGLLTFEEKTSMLADAWFGKGTHDETTQIMAQFVIDGGVHGSEKNKMSVHKADTKSKFKRFWHSVFVPYEGMQCKYQILVKYPVLLPFCWVARWFEIFNPKKAKNFFKRIDTGSSVTSENQEKIETLLKNIKIVKN